MTKDYELTYTYSNLAVLNKDQTFELLEFLTERISKHFIMMGGLLYIIRKNKWYEPHQTFMSFCDMLVGIQYRRAMYMIQIYESLLTNNIPFEDVQDVGFTKLVLLSQHLTETNYSDLIAWAKGVKTQDIELELKKTALKSKEFLAKVQNSDTLSPDFKETVKVVKPTTSNLKKLILSTPIDALVDALRLIYPSLNFEVTQQQV